MPKLVLFLLLILITACSGTALSIPPELQATAHQLYRELNDGTSSLTDSPEAIVIREQINDYCYVIVSEATNQNFIKRLSIVPGALAPRVGRHYFGTSITFHVNTFAYTENPSYGMPGLTPHVVQHTHIVVNDRKMGSEFVSWIDPLSIPLRPPGADESYKPEYIISLNLNIEDYESGQYDIVVSGLTTDQQSLTFNFTLTVSAC